MKLKLVFMAGNDKGKSLEVSIPAVLGRGRHATLRIRNPMISRKHCEIFESNGQLVVRDLGSLNGTFLGNQRITEAVLLPGEFLALGMVVLRAEYGDLVSEVDLPTTGPDAVTVQKAFPQPVSPDVIAKALREESVSDDSLGGDGAATLQGFPPIDKRSGSRDPATDSSSSNAGEPDAS